MSRIYMHDIGARKRTRVARPWWIEVSPVRAQALRAHYRWARSGLGGISEPAPRWAARHAAIAVVLVDWRRDLVDEVHRAPKGPEVPR